MYNKCKAILIASNQRAVLNQLCIGGIENKLFILNTGNSVYNCNSEGFDWKPQHLYIISENEIKEGDWMLDMYSKNTIPVKCVKDIKSNEFFKKIIATTDKRLGITDHRVSPVPNFCDFPQISQQFIEQYITEYNKGNIISDVLVEFEYFVEKGTIEILDNKYEIFYPKKCSMSFGNLDEIKNDKQVKSKLKINPDNTINIKTVKDSFSRDEVIKLIESFTIDTHHISLNKHPEREQAINKWIVKNL